jgi:AraC family transcriptional regulator
MEYRIVVKPAFKFIGYALETSTADGRNQREIPAFWQRYIANRGWEQIPNAVRRDTPVELGICADMNMETCTFTYLIGMETESFDNAPDDLVCREFPEAEYAVFTTPKATRAEFVPTIQATWKAIFEEWFPRSGYEHAGTAEIEWYDDRSGPNAGDEQQIDIYIPIRRKGG